jgi:hypothetical protein
MGPQNILTQFLIYYFKKYQPTSLVITTIKQKLPKMWIVSKEFVAKRCG